MLFLCSVVPEDVMILSHHTKELKIPQETSTSLIITNFGSFQLGCHTS